MKGVAQCELGLGALHVVCHPDSQTSGGEVLLVRSVQEDRQVNQCDRADMSGGSRIV